MANKNTNNRKTNMATLYIERHVKKRNKIKRLLDDLDRLQGSLLIIDDKVGIEDVTGLEKVVAAIDEYVEDNIMDLEEWARDHDPLNGINSSWAMEIVHELRGE